MRISQRDAVLILWILLGLHILAAISLLAVGVYTDRVVARIEARQPVMHKGEDKVKHRIRNEPDIEKLRTVATHVAERGDSDWQTVLAVCRSARRGTLFFSLAAAATAILLGAAIYGVHKSRNSDRRDELTSAAPILP